MFQGVRRTLAVSTVMLICACGGGGGGGGFGGGVVDFGTRPQERLSAAIAKSTDSTLGNILTLDGSGSTSGTGKPVTYSWFLQSKPLSSNASLLESTSAKPRFLLDEAGDYVVRLVVNDGEKDSAPAYLTITPVAPVFAGPVLKFALIETTDFQTTNRDEVTSPSSGCSFQISEGLAGFGDFPSDIFKTCYSYDPAADFQVTGSTSGRIQISPENKRGPFTGYPAYVRGVGGDFPADTPAVPIRLSYVLGTDGPSIARIPIGKSGNSFVRYNFSGPGSFYPGPDDPLTRRKISYRFIGSSLPQNAPKGWEAIAETTIKVDLNGYIENQLAKQLTIYSKQFSFDFDEKLEFNPNPSIYPDFTVDQSLPEITITHRIAFRRTKN